MAKYTESELYALVTNLVHGVVIGKRGDESKGFEVHAKDMTIGAIEYVLRYGIQRGVNDRCGGSDRTLEEKAEIAQDIITSWYTGTMRQRANAANPVDAFTAFCHRAAWATLAKAEKKRLADSPEKDAKEKHLATMVAAWSPEMVAMVREEFDAETAANARKAKLVAMLAQNVEV